MARYQGDPYWLTLRYDGECRRCHRVIKKGEPAFRYKDGSLYCGGRECGEEASREFEAARESEAFDNSERW